MCHSYIHYSYLQIPCLTWIFKIFLTSFRYTVCFKAQSQKEHCSFLEKFTFLESKGTSKKAEQ